MNCIDTKWLPVRVDAKNAKKEEKKVSLKIGLPSKVCVADY
jgi:hypothetical protein